ncbi:MAG TPA: hypothetical protein VFV07_07095 [Rhizomicrobium sp.]|nr:hypothetical protein [Rhizomicrobium sp.]
MIRLSAVLFLSAISAAQADPLEGIYGNTATSTGPNGKTTTYYFNRDGTFENHFPSGRVIKGTFVWKDAQTACFTVTDPAPAKGEDATNCRAFPVAHHVGDVWTEKDSDGVPYTNAIKAGR